MTRPVIGVALTVHDRRELTLRCLDHLAAQVVDADLRVTLVDDGSSDGTAQAVRDRHPDVQVVQGDGTLFWNRGMALALATASAADPDHYLWLNDDTFLDVDAVQRLLDHLAAVDDPTRPAVVAGCVEDPDRGVVVYGGRRRHPDRPMRFDLVAPAEVPEPVDTFDGNVVLVPRAVVRRIGHHDERFHHAVGDWDYGLRLQRAGGQVWAAPGTVGTCRHNPGFVASGGPVRQEWRRLRSLHHLPPDDWAVFVRRWSGRAWPLWWASPYVRRAGWIVRARARALRTGSAPTT